MPTAQRLRYQALALPAGTVPHCRSSGCPGSCSWQNCCHTSLDHKVLQKLLWLPSIGEGRRTAPPQTHSPALLRFSGRGTEAAERAGQSFSSSAHQLHREQNLFHSQGKNTSRNSLRVHIYSRYFSSVTGLLGNQRRQRRMCNSAEAWKTFRLYPSCQHD